MTSSCSPAFMMSTACAHPAAACARSVERSSESHVNPSPNEYQSTPSSRPSFSSPTFQSPDLMNCTTATDHPRAIALTITPNAADDLPLPSPVLISTSDGAPCSPSGRGSSVGAASSGASLVMRVGSVRSRHYHVEPSTAQRSPVRIRHCPATVVAPGDRTRSSPACESGRLWRRRDDQSLEAGDGSHPARRMDPTCPPDSMEETDA